ncbi:hypothetical protein [Alteromonas sp. a30]|uniref:hypothetical protein n=1 Tax=Alteromonas sp. a30 TaxID=2730917 RepID=UPI0022829D91|nr:hypothetical protein [Alteromonas sp. a30]MCY7295822.1 hypothetical protein [Alteromonas sp. a30]
MFSAIKNRLIKPKEDKPQVTINSGDAENELLDDLIEAMQLASTKGMTDQQISSIISQAACQVGINLMTPPGLEEELSSNDVITYLRSFVQYLKKAD